MNEVLASSWDYRVPFKNVLLHVLGRGIAQEYQRCDQTDPIRYPWGKVLHSYIALLHLLAWPPQRIGGTKSRTSQQVSASRAASQK